MSAHTRDWRVTCVADNGKSDATTVVADGPREAIRRASKQRWPGLHVRAPRRTADGRCAAVAYADVDLTTRTGEITAEVRC